MKNQAQIERKSKTRAAATQTAQTRIWTGLLVWDAAEYNAAVRAGRFVRMPLTTQQHVLLRATRDAFLRICTAPQLKVLRNATPLYCTEFHREKKRPAELTLLRGNGPGGIDLHDSAFRKAIGRELRRRAAVC